MELKALKLAAVGLGGSIPDVLWDGYYNADLLVEGEMPEKHRICINNGEAGMLDADGPNGYKNPSVMTDGYQCDLPKLPAVKLASAEQ